MTNRIHPGSKSTWLLSLACFALAPLAACGGDEEGEAAAAEPPLSAAQETQLQDYCRDHCGRTAPADQAQWLTDVCVSGCATGHRAEMAAGTWEPPAAGAPAAGGGPVGCPNSAECMNTCISQCEGQHGPMNDLDATRACIQRGGGPEECATAGMNVAANNCQRTCRGLPAI